MCYLKSNFRSTDLSMHGSILINSPGTVPASLAAALETTSSSSSFFNVWDSMTAQGQGRSRINVKA